MKYKFFIAHKATIAVAPLAGAWIEIIDENKYNIKDEVAPLAGAWIEIILSDVKKAKKKGRSPRGSVD